MFLSRHTKRREFMTLLAGAAASCPLAARGQQPKMPVIGYLDFGSPEPSAPLVAAFRKGLSEIGFVEGRNLSIEYRWARNLTDLTELAADLVRRRVAVIATGDATPNARAAKAATATIPIVFCTGLDPVETGLVGRLDRPGGNVTGVTHMNAELGPKRLGLLHDLSPEAKRIAVFIPSGALTSGTAAGLQVAALVLGAQIEFFPVDTAREADAAFASFLQGRSEALMVSPGLSFERRSQILTLATRRALPAIYPWREDAVAGGLMSYGIILTDQLRQVGIYTGRILKGEKPGDLPVMRPSKFEFVVNLQTARALNLTVPPDLLSIADEVIE
jgi:putative ABC transport system substrate-binding protein